MRLPKPVLLAIATGGFIVGGLSILGLFTAAVIAAAITMVTLPAAALVKMGRQNVMLLLRGLAEPRGGALMTILVESSGDAILAVSERGEIRIANPAARTLFGYTGREIVGRNVAMLLPNAPAVIDYGPTSRSAPPVGHVFDESGTRRIVAVDRHGGRKILDATISKMRLDREHLAIVIARDATKRADAEQALMQARDAAELSSRSKTEFLHNMSHELRTPLNAIIGFSEVMQRETFGPLGAKYVDYAKDIQASGRHLLSVINDILDVAKIESGKFELTEERVAIADILDSTIRLVRHRAMRAGVTLLAPLAEALPVVRADGRVLKQVLLNLLDNATKFTAAGGRIVVTAGETATGSVEITVADNGIGIPADRIDNVMQPFVQVGSPGRNYGGTGLGLPLASRFMEMHGGKLILRSELGAGTTATIQLPSERVFPSGAQDTRIAS